MVDETHGGVVRIRYEMAIERSLRSTIKQLMELKRTGADLNDPDEPEPSAAGGPGPRCGRAPDTGGLSHQWHPERDRAAVVGCHRWLWPPVLLRPRTRLGKAQPRHPGEAEAPGRPRAGPAPRGGSAVVGVRSTPGALEAVSLRAGSIPEEAVPRGPPAGGQTAPESR